MNKNKYKTMIAALLLTTIGNIPALAASQDTTPAIIPVNLSQVVNDEGDVAFVTNEIRQTSADAKSQKNKKSTVTTKPVASTIVSAVTDPAVPAEVRESLATTITDDMQRSAEKHAKEGKIDPVIVIGQVPEDATVNLDLPRTVQMALDYNRNIKMTNYDLQSADYDITVAKAGKMPTVTYAWEGGRSRSIGNTGAVTIGNAFSNAFNVSIPLYTGGKVEKQIANAKLGKKDAQEEVLDVEQETKLSAVEGYFALLAYRELQDVAHMSVSNLQGHVDNVTAQFNAGTVAKLDVLTSSVSLADAKTTAVTADNNVDVAEANLNNILGLPLQTKLELADHRLPFDSYDITLQQALDYAMKYRPDVLQAALAVQEAENSIGIAQAGNRPTVSVGAGNGWKDDDFPGTSNRNWSISGGISWSLWDGGSTNAKVKQAKLALLKARENEQAVRESGQLSVKQAYLNLRSAYQKVLSTQAAIAQAEEAFKIARVRYQTGVGINLDVLDAELDLDQARTNNIQALYDYNVGIATLEKEMGVDVRSGVVHPSLPLQTTIKA